MCYKILSILCIFVIIFYLTNYLLTDSYTHIDNFDNQQKPIIWQYWETLPNKTKPGYVDLCLESVKFNCSSCFDIRVLDNITINEYLSNTDIRPEDLSKLNLPQKVDYYRYCLLEKYGGIWLDADIIVLKCICPYYKKMAENNHDYIGFGCGYDSKTCQSTLYGYGKPLNWFMISKPNSPYIKCIKDSAEEKIRTSKSTLPYHDIGKVILDKCHSKLKNKNGWTYSHISSKCQEYDTKGNKLNNIMKKFNWEDCKEERYFFPLYNTAPGYPDWFKNLTKDELLEKDTFLKPIIDSAFVEKPSCGSL